MNKGQRGKIRNMKLRDRTPPFGEWRKEYSKELEIDLERLIEVFQSQRGMTCIPEKNQTPV